MNLVLRTSILGILLLTQSCSSPQQNSKQGNSVNNNQTSPQTVEQVKEVKSTKAVPLAVKVEDKLKASPKELSDTKMHLVVVSDDLRFFQHETPIYKAGKFEVNPDFPAPGNYTVFSEYSVGSNKELKTQRVKIPGDIPLPNQLESFSSEKITNNTKVLLRAPKSNFKSGQQVNLSFNLQDAKNNQPVKDLQPYPNKTTNEKARLFIVRSSSPLQSTDYVPATLMTNSPDGQVSFMANFPQKGTYKLWLQFNRNGKANTADFWLDVK
jgi:hypothetical protein